jgi:hypothetical protein
VELVIIVVIIIVIIIIYKCTVWSQMAGLLAQMVIPAFLKKYQ